MGKSKNGSAGFITITHREVYDKQCEMEKRLEKIEQRLKPLDELGETLEKMNGRLNALEKLREKIVGAALAISAIGTLTINWAGSFLDGLLK